MKHFLIAAASATLLCTAALAQSGHGYDEPSSPPPAAGAQRDCSVLEDALPGQACSSNLSASPAKDAQQPLSLAESKSTGMITSVDTAAGTITLDDGKTYGVPANIALDSFMLGQKVTIAFADQDGKLTASGV